MPARYAILVVLVLTTAANTHAEPTTQPSAFATVPTKEKLVADIQAARASIKDLSVSSIARVTEGAIPEAYPNFRVTVVLKGPKVYLDEQLSRDDGQQLARTNCYDGTRTTIIAPERSGAIQAGLAGDQWLMSRHFFILNMYDPITNHSGDLLKFVQSPLMQIHAQIELLDKHPCVVVDHVMPGTKEVTETVWLDADRGYLPIQHIIHNGKNPRIQYQLGEATKVTDSMWFATDGLMQVFPRDKDDKDIPKTMKTIMRVESTTEGWALKVNQGIADAFFALPARVPVGTKLWDMQSGKTWIVGFNDPPTTRPARTGP